MSRNYNIVCCFLLFGIYEKNDITDNVISFFYWLVGCLYLTCCRFHEFPPGGFYR